jgi:hypothetical protein
VKEMIVDKLDTDRYYDGGQLDDRTDEELEAAERANEDYWNFRVDEARDAECEEASDDA